MADLTGMMQAAAGAAGGPLFIQDVYSTTLYTGNGSTQTITNGIDLAGEGGLIWIKARDDVSNHIWTDTIRGTNAQLNSNSDGTGTTSSTTVTAFNATGFNLSTAATVNRNGFLFTSWTFRKAPKFFDVMTYTGNGSTQTLNHNLASTPGMIIIKRIISSGDWRTFQIGLASPFTTHLRLNEPDNTSITSQFITATSATTFTLGNFAGANENGGSYMAYLFAHNAGGFGNDGLQNVISCGGYAGNGSATGPTVTLGYEPQWLMIKRTDSTGDWIILDSKRDVSNPRNVFLEPNNSDAEASGNDVDFNATSFQLKTTSATVNASGSTYIYVAIRADM